MNLENKWGLLLISFIRPMPFPLPFLFDSPSRIAISWKMGQVLTWFQLFIISPDERKSFPNQTTQKHLFLWRFTFRRRDVIEKKNRTERTYMFILWPKIIVFIIQNYRSNTPRSCEPIGQNPWWNWGTSLKMVKYWTDQAFRHCYDRFGITLQ